MNMTWPPRASTIVNYKKIEDVCLTLINKANECFILTKVSHCFSISARYFDTLSVS